MLRQGGKQTLFGSSRYFFKILISFFIDSCKTMELMKHGRGKDENWENMGWRRLKSMVVQLWTGPEKPGLSDS